MGRGGRTSNSSQQMRGQIHKARKRRDRYPWTKGRKVSKKGVVENKKGSQIKWPENGPFLIICPNFQETALCL